MRIEDWDDAYANREHIPGAEDFIARWTRDAVQFRKSLGDRAAFDLAYGTGPRHRFDLFRPDGPAQGLVVFVHGGYWRAFDKSQWSHLAAGPLAAGWAVAMPSYTLVPEGSIAGISAEVARAISAASDRVPGPLRLAGHSAGGHLVMRQICTDTALPRAVLDRIAHVLSISGVHDLRPLLRTAMNADFRLDMGQATAESPALLHPIDGVRATVWVGGDERPEFVRQSTLLANIWTGLGADMAQVKDAGRHHFDVIDGLRTADTPLTRCLLNTPLP